MQKHRTVAAATTPPSPDSTLRWPAIASRSARRATARRASSRRATARRHRYNVEGRIIEYLKDHPRSTTGDIAKAVNADRATIAAERAHMVRAGEHGSFSDGRDTWVESGPSAAYTFLYRE
jgi:hypothetical protein